MEYDRKYFEDLFANDFSGIGNFNQNIIFPIFGVNPGHDDYTEGFEVFPRPESEETDAAAMKSANIIKINHIAKVHIPSCDVNIFEAVLDNRSEIGRSRIGIQNLVRRVLNYEAALIVFHYEAAEGRSWRISYVYKGENATNPRRFSFLCGKGYSCHTAGERFEALYNQRITMQYLTRGDLEGAFSVEALSEEFFNKYREKYFQFCDYINDNKEDAERFGPEFIDDQKLVRDYVKKMLGRIVFLYFLQKKGWLAANVDQNGDWSGGDRNFMSDLFNTASTEQQEDYLDRVLEPLFFNCLNSKRINDIFDAKVSGFRSVKIPYLNGGLFEKDRIDEPKSKFDGGLFASLFELFSQYNFTIDENDPDDAEIGVDPEMLGKIFENLLEDNKDKGTYYTPKEIVQYMCRESLISALESKNKNEIPSAEIRDFVINHTLPSGEKSISNLKNQLEEIKICDPAIGSGAFPMGMLDELYRCLITLNGGETTTSPAEIKKRIIQNNIYGVDIEQGAVDIARLRFWLAIVVDEKKPQPLPNFDYKIMLGNSLLESCNGIDLSDLATSSLFVDNDEIEKLKENQKRFFDTDNHEKKQELKENIESSVKKILNDALSSEKGKEINPVNPQFFLWHVWFSDVFKNGGFDIILGNPPYIQLQNNGGLLGNLYAKAAYETFAKTGDIYCLFFERGRQLVKNDGTVCYITSNKWMRAGYGESARKFLAEKTNPLILFDFAGVKIFKATVDTDILLFRKEKNEGKTRACTAADPSCKKNLSSYFQHSNSICSFSGSQSWTILSPIEQSIKNKIEAVGTPLKDWDIQINYGIKTGFNEAFIISGEKRKELLNSCQTEKEQQLTMKILKPILRGRDIKRYGYDFKDLWLINTHNGIKSKGIPPVDINQFPAIKNHLDKYWDKISTRDDRGITPYNLRNCAYMDDFSKPKICWASVGETYYSLADSDKYLLDTNYFFAINDPYYLLAILNSKLITFWINSEDTPIGNGGAIRHYKYNIEKLCIPQIIITKQERFKYLINQIFNKKINKENIKEEEVEIDSLVYKLYGLNKQEIAFIEGL